MSISLLLAAALAAAPADDLAVAWLRDGRVETRLASPAASARGVPLGSAWKVFVYAYAVDRGLDTPDYRCGTPRRKDEEYCCEAGGSVGRDRALAQSCGLFFAPSRLGVDAASWRAYWQGRTDDAASWLDDLDALKPETRVDASALLHALAAVPAAGREAALRALLPVAVETQGVAAQLGGSVRVKTFTWANPRRGGASIGGGAGWLADGTPVWFAASGSSRQVLQREAPRLAAWLPPLREASGGDACVIVDYFARYAIRSVDRLPVGVRAADGALDGPYRVLFENGNALTLTATGELRLDHDGGHPHLRGRLSLTEYVARVLDREADPNVTEAARALAVAARSWVVQNAAFEKGCWHVEDSTRMQRVSARPATAAARNVSLFASGLVVQGAPVRYQRDGAEPGVLAWVDAVGQARAGARFDRILADAFPGGVLAAESGEVECRRLPDVEHWLAAATSRWQRRLAREPGFEPLDRLTVCALDHGDPYSDRERMRMYVRGLGSADNRNTLAHEYVHLAFRFHPTGQDEASVERLARRLTEE